MTDFKNDNERSLRSKPIRLSLYERIHNGIMDKLSGHGLVESDDLKFHSEAFETYLKGSIRLRGGLFVRVSRTRH